jgi:hypothetical protein
MIAQHRSESNEHYTPELIVAPSRATLGEIDLDPASCEIANQVVGAKFCLGNFPKFEIDGLQVAWSVSVAAGSRVFLNPPGGKLDRKTLQPIKAGPGISSAAMWWAKLWSEWDCGNVHSAIFICFSLAIFRTAQDSDMPDVPAPFEFPFCVPRDRVNYDKVVDGVRVPTKGAPADSAIILIPPKSNIGNRAIGHGSHWLGDTVDRFVTNFRPLGKVRI